MLPAGVYSSDRLSVTFVYCIETAKNIVKLLSRPSSPIIVVFLTQAPIPNCNENPFSGGRGVTFVQKVEVPPHVR